MTIVDIVGKYYWWFNVSSTPLKDNVVLEFLNEYLKKSAWIDAMKCQILLQNKALHELILWIETIKNEEYIDQGMVSLFRHLHHVTQNWANINNNEQKFLDFASKNLFYDDVNDEHLLITLYSGIRPSMGT